MTEVNWKSDKCKHYYSAYLLKGILVNSGCNCDHPAQTEKVKEQGQEIGNCYPWSCPLTGGQIN